MPLRSRKRARYGKKKPYRKTRRLRRKVKRKSYGKKRSYRKRRGMRRMRRKLYINPKNSQTFTTLYKTGIRVSTNAGTCNYVVLAPDPTRVAFAGNEIDANGGVTANVKTPFLGSFSFYHHEDTQEAMANALNQAQRNVLGLGYEANTSSNPINVSELDNINYRNQTGGYVKSLESADSTYWKAAMGKCTSDIFFKSAITGSNCIVTVYKVKARFDIPYAAANQTTRPTAPIFDYFVDTAASNVIKQRSNAVGFGDSTLSLNQLHMACWAESMLTSVTGVASVSPAWANRQEGTTLYDNKAFLKFFKIVKQYKVELVPGQTAKISLKSKPQMLNLLREYFKKNLLCQKGSVHFVLKLEGSVGHQLCTVEQTGNQVTRMPLGTASRPNIGIMPAAVDCMCFKKFKCMVEPYKRHKFKTIATYGDYFDGGMTSNANSNYFIDSAPSDYTATPAVIN